MKNFKMYGVAVIGLAVLVGLSGCGAAGGSASESASEMVAGNVAGNANVSENGGTLSAMNQSPQKQTDFGFLKSLLIPVQSAWAAALCPRLSSYTCDSTGLITVQYSDCTYGGAGIWNGAQKFQFSSQAVCEAFANHVGIPQSGSLQRTFVGTLGSNPTTWTTSNIQIAFDTTDAAGYNNPVSGGVNVAYGVDGSGNPQRTINIQGINEVSTSVGNGKERFDHEISTDPAAPLVVVKYGANRTVESGTVILQHNLAKFVATATIQKPLTFSAGCCHPTGGTLQTTFTGSKTGSETLVFQSTCGDAQLTAPDGSSTTVFLKHCL